MKILGKIDSGSRIAEISLEELDAIALVAKMFCDLTMVIAAPPARTPVAALQLQAAIRNIPIPPDNDKPIPIKRRKPARRGGKRICLYCEKPLPQNCSPLRKTHTGDCKTLYNREYARKHWRDKQKGTKETVLPDGNPSNPALTDQERANMKQNRENKLKDIYRNIVARGD